jgi:hypothetical protein
VEEQTPGPVKKRSKSLFQSMTVFSALLMLMAYFGADYAEASTDAKQTILAAGISAVSIFMRRGIGGKPMWRSMTVISTLLMAAAYAYARWVDAPPKVTEWILVVGTVLIIIYMRRAVLSVFRERR